jgi:hypothetical protein
MRRDGRTDMTKLVANYANAPKKPGENKRGRKVTEVNLNKKELKTFQH